MVSVKKSPLPDGVVLNSRDDWRSGSIAHKLLEVDSHGKCYICEDKPSENPTVDHVVSKKYNPDLENDWNNLLLACAKCNNDIKKDSYNNIINPAIYDPEKSLCFRLSEDLRSVEITMLNDDPKTIETKALLEDVYSRNKKAFKKLIEEIRIFNYCISSLKEDPEEYISYIRESNSLVTAYSAFKRQIIRDDRELTALVA